MTPNLKQRAHEQAGEQDGGAAFPRPAPNSPTVLLIEQRERISRDYGHLFEYLGVHITQVRSVLELRAALEAEQPIGVMWDLDAGLDSGEVLHAASESDRHLAVLMVAGTDARTLGLLDSMIRFWRMTGVVMLTHEPELQELVEFLFRAGRRSGKFRLLSV